MFSPRIGWKSLSLICRSLGAMLNSGIALPKAFELTAAKFNDPKARRALERINQRIAGGDEISEAMRDQGQAFPPLMIDMVSVAEQTGSLPEILIGLADHYENNVRLRRTFLGAITWPVIQLVAAILIIAFVIFILGWIAEMRGGEPTDILGFGLIGTSGAILWLTATFGTAAALFMLYQMLAKSLLGRTVLDRMLMDVPVVGHCLRSFAIARFSWAFYLTQQTGMPIARSLDASLRATANGAFMAASPQITRDVKTGESLSEALTRSDLFPPDYLHTVYVAETSGTVPETLHRLSPQFEEQARRALAGLTSTLAWVIWALVAAFIIFIIFTIALWYIGMINDALKGI